MRSVETAYQLPNNVHPPVLTPDLSFSVLPESFSFSKEQLPEVEKALAKTEFYLNLEINRLMHLAFQAPSFAHAKRAWLDSLAPQVNGWYREHVLGDKNNVVSPMTYKRYKDGTIMTWYQDPETGWTKIARLAEIMCGERAGSDKVAAAKLEKKLTTDGMYVWISPAGSQYPYHQLNIGKVEGIADETGSRTIQAVAIKVAKDLISRATIIDFLNNLSEKNGQADKLASDASDAEILAHPVVWQADAGDSFIAVLEIFEQVIYGANKPDNRIFKDTTFADLYSILQNPSLWQIRQEIVPYLEELRRMIKNTDDLEEIRLNLARMLYNIVEGEVRKIAARSGLQAASYSDRILAGRQDDQMHVLERSLPLTNSPPLSESQQVLMPDHPKGSRGFYPFRDNFDRILAVMETMEGACGLPANSRTAPAREGPRQPTIGESGPKLEGLLVEIQIACPNCNRMIDPCESECPYCGAKAPVAGGLQISKGKVIENSSQLETLDILTQALQILISRMEK